MEWGGKQWVTKKQTVEWDWTESESSRLPPSPVCFSNTQYFFFLFLSLIIEGRHESALKCSHKNVRWLRKNIFAVWNSVALFFFVPLGEETFFKWYILSLNQSSSNVCVWRLCSWSPRKKNRPLLNSSHSAVRLLQPFLGLVRPDACITWALITF